MAMPAYNEADGIVEFLEDIEEFLTVDLDYVVIVNDQSTDLTKLTIETYQGLGGKIVLVTNERNQGHGPSFINAIYTALSFNPDIVITVDGDGQFRAADIKEHLIYFQRAGLDVLECVRTERTDPLFRKVITFSLRLFIYARTGSKPLDSNTPLRIYESSVLRDLASQLPANTLLPNLRFSALIRRAEISFEQRRIKSRQRRGISAGGSTWKAKREWLPSRRFILFCRSAVLELWRYPV